MPSGNCTAQAITTKDSPSRAAVPSSRYGFRNGSGGIDSIVSMSRSALCSH